MAKIIDSSNYEMIESGNEKFIDLSSFRSFSAASNSSGVISIVCTDGGRRVKLNKSLLEALGNPDAASVLFSENELAICAASLNTPGAFAIKKGGVIYATELADQIISMLPEVEFKPNASTRCGNILQVQEMEDGTAVIIISFKATPHN